MKAIWDNVRGLDFLESLSFVKRGKFGAIGHSLGGHNAIYTAVFDDRITVVVSSCGFDSFVLARVTAELGAATGVAAGWEFTCALDGGRGWCFGANVDGALGYRSLSLSARAARPFRP